MNKDIEKRKKILYIIYIYLYLRMETLCKSYLIFNRIVVYLP